MTSLTKATGPFKLQTNNTSYDSERRQNA